MGVVTDLDDGELDADDLDGSDIGGVGIDSSKSGIGLAGFDSADIPKTTHGEAENETHEVSPAIAADVVNNEHESKSQASHETNIENFEVASDGGEGAYANNDSHFDASAEKAEKTDGRVGDRASAPAQGNKSEGENLSKGHTRHDEAKSAAPFHKPPEPQQAPAKPKRNYHAR